MNKNLRLIIGEALEQLMFGILLLIALSFIGVIFFYIGLYLMLFLERAFPWSVI